MVGQFPVPRTGSQQMLAPDSYQSRPLQVGDEVTLMRDPVTGVVRLPLPNPRLQLAMPFVVGVGVVVLGAVDLRE